MANPISPKELRHGLVASEEGGSELCTQCGLCCMGVIHRSAVLDEDEISRSRALGLSVLDTAKPAFALPCPRLIGTQCGIYEARPRVCARYHCQLLDDYAQGRIDLAGSLEHVRAAMALLQAVRSAMPPEMTYAEAQQLTNGPRDTVQAPAEDQSDLRLRTAKLELYLDRHFRNARDKRSFQSGTDEMQSEPVVSERRFRRSDDAIHGDVGDDVVALHIPNGRCYGMEEVTASVWKILARPSTIGDICATLEAEYEVGGEECRADVSELLGQLVAEGLVEVAGNSAAT